MLFVEKLQTRRQGRLFEFSLKLQPGEIGLLLGRSGSGKSTLLEMLAGFLPISGGTLLADGQNIATLPPAQRPFTMLFQQNNLFEHLTGLHIQEQQLPADQKKQLGPIKQRAVEGVEHYRWP